MSTLDRYELFEVIGEGGMATVHLARLRGAAGFSRVVAVKRLRPHLARDPDFVAMFLDEVRVASRIRHPNVVQVIDVVAQQQELFLVLEYIDGVSLARLVPGEDPTDAVPPAIAASLFVGVLDALHAAHEARDKRGEPLQIVHRDVSPQNILVGRDGLAHLLDFGIAKAVGRNHVTRDGALKGKIPYIAPEQLRGDHATRTADVYSAAVTLWETLTGTRLFTGPNQSDVVLRVLAGSVRPPSTISIDVPPALDAVVMRGLDRERTRRFPTAAAMARAIESAIAPASANVVMDWLAGRAGVALEERARTVAALERTQAVADECVGDDPVVFVPAATADDTPPDATRTDVVEPASTEASQRDPRGRRLAALGAAFVLLMVGALALRAMSTRGPTPPTEARGSPNGTNVDPMAESPTVIFTGSLPAPTAASGAPAESLGRNVPRDARPSSVRRPSSNKPTSDPCDPPFTIEGDHKVWKRSCL